jgi:hypothetical protein
MKKSKLIILLVLTLIAVIIITAILIERSREKRVNTFEFPNTMQVTNITTHKRADTLAMIVLNKIFQYDTIKLDIAYAPQNLSNAEYDIVGFIQKNPYVSHTYIIFVKKGTIPISMKKFLSHELIHLQQMELGDLIQLDNRRIIYKNDTIYFSEVPYDERLYEKDAFLKEDKIYKNLNKLLYSK